MIYRHFDFVFVQDIPKVIKLRLGGLLIFDTLYDNKVCCVYLLVWCIVIGYFLIGGAGVQCRVSCRSVVH